MMEICKHQNVQSQDCRWPYAHKSEINLDASDFGYLFYVVGEGRKGHHRLDIRHVHPDDAAVFRVIIRLDFSRAIVQSSCFFYLADRPAVEGDKADDAPHLGDHAQQGDSARQIQFGDRISRELHRLAENGIRF